MTKLISPFQSAFVPGRQITDNIVIVQEVLHTMKQKGRSKPLVVVKIDLAKAYDRLRWSFIRSVLMDFNLPHNVVEVIMNCITTSKMRTLWNGTMTDSFEPSRGIRQGDPLSPYLFVLCMECLTYIIEEAVAVGAWTLISLTHDGPQLSHLLFADDVVLFGEASFEQAEVMKNCLLKFCDTSGQIISFEKSQVLFSKAVNDDLAEGLAISWKSPLLPTLGNI